MASFMGLKEFMFEQYLADPLAKKAAVPHLGTTPTTPPSTDSPSQLADGNLFSHIRFKDFNFIRIQEARQWTAHEF